MGVGLSLRDKMIFINLLLITLASCVCARTFVVSVSQTSYRAEEERDVKLDWTFSKPLSSLHPLSIACKQLLVVPPSNLFELHEGVEVPESQDQEFAALLQCDKDSRRKVRFKFPYPGLKAEDLGVYKCDVLTKDGRNYKTCWINVGVAAETPTWSPQPESPSEISHHVELAAGASLVLFVLITFGCLRRRVLIVRTLWASTRTPRDPETVQTLLQRDETGESTGSA